MEQMLSEKVFSKITTDWFACQWLAETWFLRWNFVLIASIWTCTEIRLKCCIYFIYNKKKHLNLLGHSSFSSRHRSIWKSVIIAFSQVIQQFSPNVFSSPVHPTQLSWQSTHLPFEEYFESGNCSPSPNMETFKTIGCFRSSTWSSAFWMTFATIHIIVHCV